MLPIRAASSVSAVRSNLEVIKDQSDLFIGSSNEYIGTISLAGVVRRVARRVKLSFLAT